MRQNTGHRNPLFLHILLSEIDKSINPFVPNAPFLYPWKHQKSCALGTNGLEVVKKFLLVK